MLHGNGFKGASLAIACAVCVPMTALAEQAPPKLVLQITVDALRADLPERYLKNMGKGGFRYLLNEGIHYTNAHYQHANTETVVGHASLATGAPPAVHGMIGNVWFDRAQDRVVYNIEDANYSLLTAGADVDKDTELDTTQKAAKSDGRSPMPFLSSTLSDEIASAYNGQSKIFSVSFKDRGAVTLAGEFGKAFWFSKAAANFVTSDYYYKAYPQWVSDWNNTKPAEKYSNSNWELMLDKANYVLANEKNTSYKTDLAGFGKTFPHPYGAANGDYFTTLLSLSPAGDELTLDFAKTLIEKEQLGKNSVPDYLAVSFSANDYVIHMYGPSSLEAEDNLLRLDKTLAALFNYIDKKVGLDNTLIVLSADHGAPEVPGYLKSLGGQKAHYFSLETLKDKAVFDKLKARFGVGEELFELYSHPYIYLDHKLIAKNKLNLAEVQAAVAKEVTAINGIDYAVTSADIEAGRLPDTRVMRLITNNHNPLRSGDIYLVYSPKVYINDFDGLQVASVHGSPWRYDTHVPIFFAGAGIDDAVISREVTPYDIAPTISNFLGITLPSGATGKVLKEVVEDK
jgi:predicted AlkP superfamily pyrophosphatase or phosphodiesterase